MPGYLHRLHDDQYVLAEGIRVDQVHLDAARHDAAAQLLEKDHVALTTSFVAATPPGSPASQRGEGRGVIIWNRGRPGH